jgi:hypothetical protein
MPDAATCRDAVAMDKRPREVAPGDGGVHEPVVHRRAICAGLAILLRPAGLPCPTGMIAGAKRTSPGTHRTWRALRVKRLD